MTAPQQQKLRITGPVVVTANRLGDGAVVYLTAGKEWTTRIEDAAVVTTASAATELMQAAAARRCWRGRSLHRPRSSRRHGDQTWKSARGDPAARADL